MRVSWTQEKMSSIRIKFIYIIITSYKNRKLFFFWEKNTMKINLVEWQPSIKLADIDTLELQFPHQSLVLSSWNHFTGEIQIRWCLVNFLILFFVSD